MNNKPSYLELDDGSRIAYHKTKAKTKTNPTIIFIHGFKSDMDGTKAIAIEEHCQKKGLGYIRFDCTGHGQSSGDFLQGTIGRWADDLLAVIDNLTNGNIILIGSSMGGWLMLLAALKRPERITAMIGIAAAPDFTEDLIWQKMTEDQKNTLQEKGMVDLAIDEESPEPYPITQLLIEEARQHLLLEGGINITCPTRLIHGAKDTDVPLEISYQIKQLLTSTDIEVIVSENGDHRMSEPEDIALILSVIDTLL
jgi:pimeloyl-ACP methyl ester carboxylesterase